jgi:hypothetical protein
MGRPNSSPPKLIDEYDWIVHTSKCPRPSALEAAEWKAVVARRLREMR